MRGRGKVLLVLIRHGQAADVAVHQDDALRELTQPGRRALAASLPTTLALLEPTGNVRILSSPYVRTEQTAQVVAHVLGLQKAMHAAPTPADVLACKAIPESFRYSFDVEPCPALAADDPAEFLSLVADELTAPDAPTADSMLIAVGHNPFLSDVTRQLCGMDLTFGKGSATCIALDELASKTADGTVELSGTLRWFVQGAEAKRWQVPCRIEEVLHGQALKVGVLMEGFLDDPDDPETVHDLRVSIRTLRSSLSFITPFQKRSQNRMVDGNLRMTVRRLSRLRELDVLCDHVATSLPDTAPFLAACRQARHAECRRTLRALKNRRARSVLDDALESTDQVIWRRTIEHSGLLAKSVAERFSCLMRRFETDLDDLDVSNPQATHALRKSAKQLRYVSNAFGDLLGEDTLPVYACMTRMQDDLGALCDARVNQALLAGFNSHGLSPQAKEELNALLGRQVLLTRRLMNPWAR